MANLRTFGSSLSSTGSALLGAVDSVTNLAKLSDMFIQRKLEEQAATSDIRKNDNVDAVTTSATLATAKRRMEVGEYAAKSASHQQALVAAAKTLQGGGQSLLDQLIAGAEKQSS